MVRFLTSSFEGVSHDQNIPYLIMLTMSHRAALEAPPPISCPNRYPPTLSQSI